MNIEFDASHFRIRDNCGGIPSAAAIDYAFTFGRVDDRPTSDFAVGVYGIGMKRAVFKLGQKVRIHSTPKSEESFSVPIDVDAWLDQESSIWDFEIDPADPLAAPGVEIYSTELSDEAESVFRDPTFETRLRRTIGQGYLLALMQGLHITVNHVPVDIVDLTLKLGGEFESMRESYDIGDVSVEIYAGMMNEPPDDAEPQKRPSDRHSGWYVLCNGRAVLSADRTSLTVWGVDDIPMWHRQYEGFVGIALFSAQRPELLPMTTTKNGIDSSSRLFQRARAHMAEPTRAWIDYTNARKTRREEATKAEAAARSVPLEDVPRRGILKVPSWEPKKTPPQAHVNYAVSRRKIRALARAFGKATMNYRQVGLESFDYAYDQLVEEDDS